MASRMVLNDGSIAIQKPCTYVRCYDGIVKDPCGGCNNRGQLSSGKPCEICRGNGYIGIPRRCPYCNGTGIMTEIVKK